jgi:hypothetical protein
MKALFSRLKEKWGIESNVQFLLINLVFALAGFSVVFIRPLLFSILGITPEMPFALRTILYLLLVTPVYFTMLNLFALLLGQSRFFLGFTRKTFSRIPGRKKGVRE